MGKTGLYRIALFMGVFILLWGCAGKQKPAAFLYGGGSFQEDLALKELRRYLYLSSGQLPEIISGSVCEAYNDKALLLISPVRLSGQERKEICQSAFENETLPGDPEAYALTTLENESGRHYLISGSSKKAILFAGYKFLELSQGISFSLHDEIIPFSEESLFEKEISYQASPDFKIRGILPFHDFPEGPDWWTREDYLTYITQLPKMGMNFFGLHTYPFEDEFNGMYRAEPTVWIGSEKHVEADGSVSRAYPSMHFETGGGTWGYAPGKTGEYSCGASRLFADDRFGAHYMKGAGKWPHSEETNLRIFNDFGELLSESFGLAQKLGVFTCIGTETPLKIPSPVLEEGDAKLTKAELSRKYYRGLFNRILATHPLDYYWLWTPEPWTWNSIEESDILATEQDIHLAAKILRELNAPIKLATSGWVLSPPDQPARFYNSLPEDLIFSAINRFQGFAPIDSAFADYHGRERWAIPWLEDDPALLTSQFWAGRIFKDAFDALSYQCDGLIGIHWRTSILDPNFKALSLAGWKADDFSVLPDTLITRRHLPVEDFYLGWAEANFGANVALEASSIFASIDGGGDKQQYYRGNFPRTSDWYMYGPGRIIEAPCEPQEIDSLFAFIGTFRKLKFRIADPLFKENHDYWLNTFLFAKHIMAAGNHRFRTDSLISLPASEIPLQELWENRISLAKELGKAYRHLLQSVQNSSDLGTITNLELQNLGTNSFLTRNDSLIEAVCRSPLPPEAYLPPEYQGKSRLIVPVRQRAIQKGESLEAPVYILHKRENEFQGRVYFRSLGSRGKFSSKELTHHGRGVYGFNLGPDEHLNQDFEYYIEARAGSDILNFPARAKQVNHSVIILPE